MKRLKMYLAAAARKTIALESVVACFALKLIIIMRTGTMIVPPAMPHIIDMMTPETRTKTVPISSPVIGNNDLRWHLPSVHTRYGALHWSELEHCLPKRLRSVVMEVAEPKTMTITTKDSSFLLELFW